MLKIAVLVSGGGTNLQAIIDAIADGTITDTQIVAVISNNAGAYALERANAAGIAASCISPKNYESRALFNEALLEAVQASGADLHRAGRLPCGDPGADDPGVSRTASSTSIRPLFRPSAAPAIMA